MIRILIADDHNLIREGLKQILSAASDLVVVGEAGDGTGVMQRVRELNCDVLVLDLSMPGRSGTELIRQVRAERPNLRILVLSMHEEHQYAVRALKSGASGYLTKDCASADLVSAIRKVAGGGAFISATVAEQLAMGAMGNSGLALHHTLSNREFEVLHMLASGQAVSEIARQLNLSVKTVSTHKAHLMRKLNLRNQADLIRYAIGHRLTDDPPALA